MRRTELRRRTPLRASQTPLKHSALHTQHAIRAKRTRDDVPAAVRRAVHHRSGGWCECGCGRPAQHIHHRRMRSQGGRHELVNLLDLSLHCHEQAHANPERSYALGLIVRSWCDPADVPVIRAGEAA